MLITTLWLLPAHAALGEEDKEYFVKAAFLYKFTNFVNWPVPANGGKNEVNICIYGQDPFGKSLSIIEKASNAQTTYRIVRSVPEASLGSCQILFISETEKEQLGSLLQKLKGLPVLTVSEIDDFVQSGGMIGFIKVDNRIKLNINAKSAADAKLRIDAQLLEIAVDVIKN